MSRNLPFSRQKVLEDIVSAKENGVRFFINSLIHNYSLVQLKQQTGESIYVGNPTWEEGKNLSGKRLLEESEVIKAVLPDTILMEGESPSWVYNPRLHQPMRDAYLSRQNCVSSPNLHEIIDDVELLQIIVRGCDISEPQREEVKKNIGYTKHVSDGCYLIRFFQHLLKRKYISPEEQASINSFLADERPRKNLNDPNYYYLFCCYLESFLGKIEPQLLARLQWHTLRFLDAKRAFRDYIHARDMLIPQVLKEELVGERTVLLKIGNAHMNVEYGLLPNYLVSQKIPYYHFFNHQAHSDKEVAIWEKMKDSDPLFSNKKNQSKID